MPKLKTKSSVKKRFKISANGKVLHKPAGKKHGMSKRSKSFIRKQRPMSVLCEADAEIVKLFFFGKKVRRNKKAANSNAKPAAKTANKTETKKSDKK